VHLVITAGGLGPAVDDRTLEGLSDALRLPLTLNAPARDMIEAAYPGAGLTSAMRWRTCSGSGRSVEKGRTPPRPAPFPALPAVRPPDFPPPTFPSSLLDRYFSSFAKSSIAVTTVATFSVP